MKEYFSYLDPHTPSEEVYGLYITNNTYTETSTPHRHNFCEFSLMVKGSIFHIINDYTYTITEGMLTFIRADDKHFYRKIDNTDMAFYNIGIPNDILNMIFRYYHIERNSFFSLPKISDVHLSHDDYITLKKRIIKFMETPYGEEHSILFLNIVSDVLYHITSAINKPQSLITEDGAPSWFSNLLMEMENSENYIVGLPKLKELSSCSFEHLSRYFKKYLNCTPTQYINRLRVDHAVQMLRKGECTILEACFSSGFNNEGYFYWQFKKYYSMTPLDFINDEKRNCRSQIDSK